MRPFRFALFVLCAVFGVVAGARAEPAKGSFTVGLLWPVGAQPDWADALIHYLKELGYEQGRNLTLIQRTAKTSNVELPTLAAELVALKPDVLVATSTPPSLALKGATSTLPIVAVNIGDPVGSHLVESLAHPGGNVTGTANAAEQWIAKRMEEVKEVFPAITCVLTLRNTQNRSIMMMAPTTERLAAKTGFAFRPIDVDSFEALDKALAEPPPEDCKTALLLPLDSLFLARRAEIVDYALRNRVALFAPFRGDAEAGALIAFGIDITRQWGYGAQYVDKIFRGAKPADLPVEQPVDFDIVVNLKTAKALGVAIPQSILSLANDVIE